MNKHYTLFSKLKTKRILKVVLLFTLLFGFTGIYAASTQAASPSATAAQDDGSIYDDEFNGFDNEINDRWQWLNEHEERWHINSFNGNLVIDGTSGDMFGTCNNTQNILLQDIPPGYFEIVTKLEIEPTENFQQGGLILMNTTNGQPDLDNYIKLDFVYSTYLGGLAVELLKETDGAFSDEDFWSSEMSATDEIELKLERSGDFINGYYRTEGTKWLWLGMEKFDLASDVKMGLFALSGIRTEGNDPTCTPNVADIPVRFDYFRVLGSNETVASTEEATLPVREVSAPTQATSAFQAPTYYASGEPIDLGIGISMILDGLDYSSVCSYVGRVAVETIQIGRSVHNGLYDVWNNCRPDNTIHGVLAVASKNNPSVRMWIRTDLDHASDVERFEDALAQRFDNSTHIPLQGLAALSAQLDGLVNMPTITEETAAVAVQPAETDQVTPAVQAVQPAQPIATVLVNTLNVRRGPGTNYERFDSIEQGASLSVIGRNLDCSWLQIRTTSGIKGWISGGAQFVTVQGACDSASVVDAPAIPASASSQPSETDKPAAPTEVQPAPVAGPDPAKACYVFQNQLGPELTFTFTSKDRDWNYTFRVPSNAELPECFSPGRYTYTIDAPPPWNSVNGEVLFHAGDWYTWPVYARD